MEEHYYEILCGRRRSLFWWDLTSGDVASTWNGTRGQELVISPDANATLMLNATDSILGLLWDLINHHT